MVLGRGLRNGAGAPQPPLVRAAAGPAEGLSMGSIVQRYLPVPGARRMACGLRDSPMVRKAWADAPAPV